MIVGRFRHRHEALRAILLAAVLVCAPGCLVLSLHPAYDDDSIGWDPRLIGAWEDADETASMEIARGEWKSYRIKYVHPAETGELTGYLTLIGDDRYLDLMAVRGEDRGSFVVSVHAVLRVRLDGERLELTPLSYDWFSDELRASRPVQGLSVVIDQKENALILSPTARLRSWLRAQPPAGSMFGASTVFTRRTFG